MTERVDLSILVCGIPGREVSRSYLLADLERQSFGQPVEVLCLYDNKQRTTGAKRNALLSLARGNYVSFIDDDDRVAHTYVRDLLSIIRNQHPDLITFDVELIQMRSGISNVTKHRLREDGHFESYGHGVGCRTDPSMHIVCWKTVIARETLYPDLTLMEDVGWTHKVVHLVREYGNIDKVLYYYNWKDG